MKNLEALFPRASNEFFRINPSVNGKCDKIESVTRKHRGKMNKTEREFSMILEAQKCKGEIIRWEYEGITLRFAGVRYTPDFVIFHGMLSTKRPAKFSNGISLIEVKGQFTKGKFERAIERFRHARSVWPEFQFELHQKTKEGWKRLL